VEKGERRDGVRAGEEEGKERDEVGERERSARASEQEGEQVRERE